MTKVMLYSGGTDSWLIDKLWKPDKRIYIDIHGMYSAEEIPLLPKDVEIIDLPYLGTIEDKKTSFIPLRNLYFLMVASNYGDEICLGATASDQLRGDKTIPFLDKTQAVFDQCLIGNNTTLDRKVVINKEFIQYNRFQLIEKYLANGGTIDEFVHNTFSCYFPVNGKECLHCKVCYKKFLNAIYFGYKGYTDEQKRGMIDYLSKNVIPRVEHPEAYKNAYITERPSDGKYFEVAIDKLFSEYNLNWKDFQ